MPYQFTDKQATELRNLRSEAQAAGTNSGLWAKAYARIAEIVETQPDATGQIHTGDDPEVEAAVIWLKGASQANSGEGAFSDLIRDTTTRQLQLHFGPDVSIPSELIQIASNEVADAVLGSILQNGTLPTVGEIADHDATQVGNILFSQTPNGEPYNDTAAPPPVGFNAAWSGSILFSMFDNGTVSSDATASLLGGDASLDSVNDLRDALFAYDAFRHAYSLSGGLASSALDYFGGDNGISDDQILSQLAEYKGVSQSELVYGTTSSLLLGTTNGHDGHTELAFVDAFGPDMLLDKLAALFGTEYDTPTSEATFVERAHALFSDLKASGELSLNIERIDENLLGSEPEVGSSLPVESMVALAKEDTARGRAFLYALHTNTPFLITGNDGAVYDRFNLDASQFSEEYLRDRAGMMSQLFEDAGDAPAADTTYQDLETGITAGADPGMNNGPQVVFGGDGADAWASSVHGESHPAQLYGLGGKDILAGGRVDDHLEGGTDDDTLMGKAGNDTLFGGRGDDRLFGSNGDDIYRYRPGDGHDVIRDLDGTGSIRSEDAPLTGTQQPAHQSDNGTVWDSADGSLTYTLTEGNLTDGGTLEIAGSALGGDGNSITIEDFENGDLGISLNAAYQVDVLEGDQPNPFTSPDHTPAAESVELAEGGTRRFTLALNQPAAAGSTVRIALAGNNAEAVTLLAGGETLTFEDGAAEFEMPADADTVTFTLASLEDVDTPDSLDLTATFVPADGDAVSTEVTVNLDATDEPDTAPETTVDIIGDREWEDGDNTEPGIQPALDQWHNPYTTGAVVHGQNDVLTDRFGNDHIAGHAGNDILLAHRGGDDHVEGGAGDDGIQGGPGADLLEGGAGDDAVIDYPDDNGGDDRLFGDTETPWAQAVQAGNTQTGVDQRGDLLSAGNGNDMAVGTNQNDLIGGGRGNDRIAGGAGDDFIFGDDWLRVHSESADPETYDAPVYKRLDWREDPDPYTSYEGHAYYDSWSQEWLDWNASLDITQEGNARSFSLDIQNAERWAAQIPIPGNDLIHGGAGDDYISGGTGVDVLFAETGNDVVFGGEGDDTVLGGDGEDILTADDGALPHDRHGHDFVDGGAGADEIYGGAGTDTLFGGDGDDALIGDITGADEHADADFIDGEGGSDWITGYGGSDTISGGAGADEIYADNSATPANYHGDDVVRGGDGDDLIFAQGGNDTVTGGLGSDQIVSDSDRLDPQDHGDDVVHGNAGADYLWGQGGNDRLHGDEGNDQLVGDDLALAAESHGHDEMHGGDGDDMMLGTGGNDVLDGGVGADHIEGDAVHIDGAYHGDDTLRGGAGEDELFGGGGSDSLYGSDGHDNLVGDDGDIAAEHHAADLLFGGTGDDALQGQGGDDSLFGGLDADNLYGGLGADLLASGAGDDLLSGGAGDDTLQGGSGNDTLLGGSGADVMAGGAGIDRYEISGSDGDVHIDDTGDNLLAATGVDTNAVTLRMNSLLLGGTSLRFNGFKASSPAGVPGITSFEFADGSFDYQQLVTQVGITQSGDDTDNGLTGTDMNDNLEGLAGDDHLFGRAGDDRLLGGAGADHMEGGSGNDTYYVDAAGDTVVEAQGGGEDTVVARMEGYVLADAVEDLQLDAGIHAGEGNAAANTLTGNAADNELAGSDGDDVLEGLGGIDVLRGDNGMDRLRGGEGNDQLHGGYGEDDLDGEAGDDFLSAGGGADVLFDDDGDNTLLGGAGDDTLTAGRGDDSLYGGNGDDILSSEAGHDLLDGGAGNDALSVSYDGSELRGGAGHDTLLGSSGDDALYGGAGDDEITARLGADTLVGGTGDDVLDASEDDYVTAPNTLTGGTGNDVLYGSFGDETYQFNLGDGNDHLIERRNGEAYTNIAASSDTLKFGTDISLEELEFIRSGDDLEIRHDNGTDAITIERWFQEPTDHFKVNSFVFDDGTVLTDAQAEERSVWTGTAQADQLIGYRDLDENVFAGAGHDQVWGRTGDDTLRGEAGNDYLDGGAGADMIMGGDGADNVVGRSGDDMLAGNLGNDTLQGGDGADAMLGGQGRDGLFGGAGGDQVYGGDGEDYLTGQAGADLLDGGANNDQLQGGAGNDTLVGGAGNDIYVFAAGGGHDHIRTDDGGVDYLLLTDGLTENRLSFSQDGEDLLIEIDDGSADSIRIENHFQGGEAAIDGVQPDGGTIISTKSINQRAQGGDSNGDYDAVLTGTDAGEQLVGGSGMDLLQALGGNDTLFGMGNNDRLEGGDGADQLYGGNGTGVETGEDTLIGEAGNDTLAGGDGDDTLRGGAGADHYYYRAGEGIDAVEAGGGSDVVFFLDGLERSRLSYHQDGNDLVMLVDGDTGQQVRVRDHFLGGDNAIAYVQPTDGGNAIPASQLPDMLSPMPQTQSFAMTNGDGTADLAGTTGASLQHADDSAAQSEGAHEASDLRVQDGLFLGRVIQPQEDNRGLPDGWFGNRERSVSTVRHDVAQEASAAFDGARTNRGPGMLLGGELPVGQNAHAVEDQWAYTERRLQVHLSNADEAALGGELAYQYATAGQIGAGSRHNLVEQLAEARPQDKAGRLEGMA